MSIREVMRQTGYISAQCPTLEAGRSVDEAKEERRAEYFIIHGIQKKANCIG